MRSGRPFVTFDVVVHCGWDHVLLSTAQVMDLTATVHFVFRDLPRKYAVLTFIQCLLPRPSLHTGQITVTGPLVWLPRVFEDNTFVLEVCDGVCLLIHLTLALCFSLRLDSVDSRDIPANH